MAVEDDEILEQLRHKELVGAIKQLIHKLDAKPNQSQDTGVKEAIEKLSDRLANMPKPDAPIVKIENKNDELSVLLQRIESAMNKPEKEPIPDAKEWHHSVIRNQQGLIDKVISTKK